MSEQVALADSCILWQQRPLPWGDARFGPLKVVAVVLVLVVVLVVVLVLVLVLVLLL